MAQVRQQQLDFLLEVVQIGHGLAIVAGDDFVARTVIAQRCTKRNVDIE
jgi:hypothetical protein